MPPVIGQSDGVGDTDGLVTGTSHGSAVGVAAAVHGAVPLHLAVDGLHDVELAAARPGRAMVDGVAEHPEGGPETFLLGGGEVAEADGGFD